METLTLTEIEVNMILFALDSYIDESLIDLECYAEVYSSLPDVEKEICKKMVDNCSSRIKDYLALCLRLVDDNKLGNIEMKRKRLEELDKQFT